MRKGKTKSGDEIIRLLRKLSPELKKSFKVKEIGIFGSYVRGEQVKGSDIDIMVELEEEALTFDNYMELKFYLEDIFSIEVDLVIKDSIKDSFKPYILEEVVYA
jgi:predicted nucleotidyltransferase